MNFFPFHDFRIAEQRLSIQIAIGLLLLWPLYGVTATPVSQTAAAFAIPPEKGNIVHEASVHPEKVGPAPPAAVTGDKFDWMRAAGIPQADWNYVDFIIGHESGWNPNAVNPSSGACGLGQQLPCGKWPHQWDDPVGALIDAHAYAMSRYGSWAAAYQFWVGHGHW
jgi:hypothetical protein